VDLVKKKGRSVRSGLSSLISVAGCLSGLHGPRDGRRFRVPSTVAGDFAAAVSTHSGGFRLIYLLVRAARSPNSAARVAKNSASLHSAGWRCSG
jgi:hypothetical protein